MVELDLTEGSREILGIFEMNWQRTSLAHERNPKSPFLGQNTRGFQLDKRRLELEKKLIRYVQNSKVTNTQIPSKRPETDYRKLYEEAVLGRKQAETAQTHLQKQLSNYQKLELKADSMRSEAAELREMLKFEQNTAKTALNRGYLQSQIHSLQAQLEQHSFHLSNLQKELLETNEHRVDLTKEAEMLSRTILDMKKRHTDRVESVKSRINAEEMSRKEVEGQLEAVLAEDLSVDTALMRRKETLCEELAALERDYEGQMSLQRDLEKSLKEAKQRKLLESWEKQVANTTVQIEELSMQLDKSMGKRKKRSKGRRHTQSPVYRGCC